MRRLSLGVLAMILISTTALADPDKGKGGAPEAKGEKHEGKGGEKHDDKSDKHDDKSDGGKAAMGDGGKTATGDDDDDESPATDGGKAVAGRRTPAQLAFRKAVWERREKALEAKVHKDGKKLTDDERAAIKAHWLRVARLMRIRELAQEDKNDAAVKRADAALEREEKSAESKLDKLNAKAPGGAK
jgi:hypothetical protein